MSPGRCAAPSGIFSTRPMAPTTLAFALREARACIRPTTQAAPAMSPFMSSMPAPGFSEMPPESKQTPLPMKASGCASRAPPFQRIRTTRLGRAEPCPTPSSARIPSASMRRNIEDLDFDAELFQFAGLFGEAFRIEQVRRQVDERAGDIDAVGEPCRRGDGRFSVSVVGAGETDSERGGRLPASSFLLFFGLELVEFIGAKAQAQREISGRRGEILGRRREIEQDSRRSSPCRAWRRPRAAEAQIIVLSRRLFRRGSQHQQPVRRKAGRGQDIEAGADLALERRRFPPRAPDSAGRVAEGGGGRRAEARARHRRKRPAHAAASGGAAMASARVTTPR